LASPKIGIWSIRGDKVETSILSKHSSES